MISSDPSPPRGRSTTGISSQSTWTKPPSIDASDSINNSIAQGHAAGAGAIKQLDRNGISRGKGHQARAAMAQAEGVAQGQAAAAQTQLEADKANSRMKTDYEFGREMEAQRLAMVQHALSQNDWSVQMAQQQAAAALHRSKQQAALTLLGSLR
jgi:hypothetical protein